MPNGLVLELQADALSSAVPVVDVLRKASVVASKLGLADAMEWIRHELNGYPNDVTCPPHRLIHVVLMAQNPYHGAHPVQFGDPETREKVSRMALRQSVAEIEVLAASKQKLRSDASNVAAAFEIDLPTFYAIGPSAMSGVLDAVRQRILEWALALEAEGILGEGLSFSGEEKQLARQGPPVINFHGAVGTANVQQQPVHSPQTVTIGANLAELRVLLAELIAIAASEPKEVAEELQPVLAIAQREAAKENPDAKKVGTALALARETAVKEGTKRAIAAIMGILPGFMEWLASR